MLYNLAVAVGYAKSCTIIDCNQSQADPMAIKISIAGTKGPAKDWNPFLHSANKGFYIYSLIQQYIYGNKWKIYSKKVMGPLQLFNKLYSGTSHNWLFLKTCSERDYTN